MAKKNQKRKGSRFEKKVQKTINSGALWFNKGDLRFENYCIEAKYTDKKGFRVSLQILEKLWRESLEANKEPLLVIGIRRNGDQIFKLQCIVNIEEMKDGIK